MNRLILLHQEGARKTIFDFRAKRYYEYYDSGKSDQPYTWLLLQPFLIALLESINHFLDAQSGAFRIYAGIFFLALGMVISTSVSEKYLSDSVKTLSERMREVVRPDTETLLNWAEDYPRRLRNAGVIAIIAAVLFAVLFLLFLYSRTGIFLTFALTVYCLAYFILASARPLLLFRYAKEEGLIKPGK